MPWTTPKTWATGELVTANDLNTQLRDNLNVLFTPNAQEVTASNGSDASTSSTTISDITVMPTVNMTTAGGNLLVVVWGRMFVSSGVSSFYVSIDGVDRLLNTIGGGAGGANMVILGFRRFTGIAAGAHTIKLRWNSDGNTLTFSGGLERRFIVAEGVI